MCGDHASYQLPYTYSGSSCVPPGSTLRRTHATAITRGLFATDNTQLLLPSPFAGVPGLPPPELDLGGTSGVFFFVSGEAGSVFLQGLLLVNMPPGRPSTYPKGLASLLGWTFDFPR